MVLPPGCNRSRGVFPCSNIYKHFVNNYQNITREQEDFRGKQGNNLDVRIAKEHNEELQEGVLYASHHRFEL